LSKALFNPWMIVAALRGAVEVAWVVWTFAVVVADIVDGALG
jgi:hypothetical protein